MPRKRPRRKYSEAVRRRFGSEGLHMRLEKDMTGREKLIAAAWRDYTESGDRTALVDPSMSSCCAATRSTCSSG